MPGKLAVNGGPKAVTEPYPEWPIIDDEVIQAVVRVLKGESISQLGKEGIVGKFEEDFARHLCPDDTAQRLLAAAGPVPAVTYSGSGTTWFDDLDVEIL